MELTYTQRGDYLLPNLTTAEAPKIGKYGMLRHTFLRENRKGTFTALMMTGRLNAHLEETDRAANEMMERLTSEMAKAQNVTESLKASNQMEWVRRMNTIRSAAEETVMSELIYS